MSAIQVQSMTNYAAQYNKKNINYAYQDWFLTWDYPLNHASTLFG